MELDSVLVCKVCELQRGDRIPSGTNLGYVTTADSVTIKSVAPAEQGRYAVTFARVGTLFVNGDLIVQVIDQTE